MKLLLDANLAPRLAAKLQPRYPGSAHVFDTPDIVCSDLQIWQYAKDHGYIIVSKDTDFLEMSLLHGPPPKVIFLRFGNCRTAVIEEALLSRSFNGAEFFSDPEAGYLILAP